MPNQLGKLRVSDPVVTQVVHGYVQAESIAPFVAPVVNVTARSGKVVKFGKEQFAVGNSRRAPGAVIPRVGVTFSSENYVINQHAWAAEVTEEEYEEAMSSDAQIDLRSQAVLRAASSVAQSWEKEVIETITTAGNYESGNVLTLSGTDQFSNAASDPESIVVDASETIRSQVGVYPNSAIISPKVYNALRLHPIFKDRIKYTSDRSVNLDMLANWFNLPRGIKVASRVYLGPDGSLMDFMNDSMVLFYNPEGEIGEGFMAVDGADRAKPSFAYTYSLNGYPIATPERYDDNTRTFVTDVIFEQSLNLVGLGATGKCGAGFLLQDVLA